jgi:molybdopterin/thiamine biosynthesis adenylyltransferase
VDLTNLQRQIAHSQARIGQPKVTSAAAAIHALNPGAQVDTLVQRADAALLDHWVPQADVVLDCSDNFATRQLVNAACVRHRRPLVSGAAIGFDGQVSVYDSRQPDAPCYACLFPPDATVEEVRCATMGVFAPLVGIIGATQAAEALKLLAGVGTSWPVACRCSTPAACAGTRSASPASRPARSAALPTESTFHAVRHGPQTDRSPLPSAEEEAALQKTPSPYSGPESSYQLAFTDHDFLLRRDLRPVRMQLELLKPELVQQEQGCRAPS